SIFDCSLLYFYGMSKGNTSVLQVTLDLMVLQTLEAMGPLHGYGVARRLEQISQDALHLNEGTDNTSVLRLQHTGWYSASWRTSEYNRRAKYYAITWSGKKQLTAERANWDRVSGVIRRVLQFVPGR